MGSFKHQVAPTVPKQGDENSRATARYRASFGKHVEFLSRLGDVNRQNGYIILRRTGEIYYNSHMGFCNKSFIQRKLSLGSCSEKVLNKRQACDWSANLRAIKQNDHLAFHEKRSSQLFTIHSDRGSSSNIREDIQHPHPTSVPDVLDKRMKDILTP